MTDRTRWGIGTGIALLALAIPLGNFASTPIAIGLALVGSITILVSLAPDTLRGNGIIYIPLHAAMRKAYEENELKLAGKAAYRLSPTHDDTLSWFFHSFLLKGVKIYACRLPSTVRRKIPDTK